MSGPEEYLKQPYARILIPEDGGGYSAEILEFPGCFAQGDTPDEAYGNLEEAAKAWIQSSLERDLAIPPPSINAGYGGKIALRIPKSAHRFAVQMAERDGVSLNQFLVSAISARIGAEDLYNRMAQKIESKINAITWDQPHIGTWVNISAPTSITITVNNVLIDCQPGQFGSSQFSQLTAFNKEVCLIKEY